MTEVFRVTISVTCPLCRAALSRDPVTWRCPAGHAFDVAREGYVNLLPVQRKKSLAPGDNADMVRARREFLDAGHYAPLRDELVALLAPLAVQRVVDIGCGEGYYTAALAHSGALAVAEAVATAAEPRPVRDVIGVDIARDAVQCAARRYPATGITWLVASSAALPLADASCDLATSLFAPVPAAEIVRVLRPGGFLLIATPAADHLWSLREALFQDVRLHEPEKILVSLEADFHVRGQRDVRFPLQLDRAALNQLLLMTPYAWRATRDRRDALAASDSLATTAAFTLFLLERT
jgi:23S rRNA (guanine745-N1)-methyltransferase